MNTKPVRVLLVGESAQGFSFLLQHLEKRGCDCYVVTSSSEAARLSVGRMFDLVLCTDPVEGINALIASLIGSPTTLFRCYPVEDSCWWLPAVRHGKKCLGAPALRPSEFASVLDRMVDEIKSGRRRGNLHHEPRLLFRVVSGCHFMRTQPTSNPETQVVLGGRAGEGSNKATGVSTKQYRCGRLNY